MLSKIIAGLIVFVMLGVLVNLGKIFEYNKIDSILVIQRLGGQVHVYTDAGYKIQNWGTATHYKKSSLLDYNAADGAQPIKVQFAEGGHGDVSGSCRIDLPLNEKQMIDIHQTFGSQEAVNKQLCRTTVERSMYMTGPLMTSTESFSVRKPDLINLFEDQAKHGVFQTQQVSREIDDPITGQKKWITVLEQKRDKDGIVMRQEESPLVRFGVQLYNVSIVGIQYEKIVQDQIAQQQSASVAVQIAIANTKKAEQDVKTFKAQGEAAAAKAKWEQEVVKAVAVTKAQQEKEVAETGANREKVVLETAAQRDLNVAKLNREAADQTKQRLILEGEGESTKRKLIMAADGALDKKLMTYERVMGQFAVAIGNYHGSLVPGVVMAGGSGGNAQNNSVNSLIDLLTINSAKQVGLDMSIPQRTANNP